MYATMILLMLVYDDFAITASLHLKKNGINNLRGCSISCWMCPNSTHELPPNKAYERCSAQITAVDRTVSSILM